MSSKTKRKYVYQEHMSEVAPPSGDQTIARLLETRGNNLHQVEDANGEVYLVSMPNKFRRNIWVRRGTFLILEPIAEGDKVRAEVVRVLSREHVAELRSAGAWPERFDEVGSTAADEAADELQNLDLEEGNPNRPPVEVETDSESESEESEEDSESDVDADRSGSESGV